MKQRKNKKETERREGIGHQSSGKVANVFMSRGIKAGGLGQSSYSQNGPPHLWLPWVPNRLKCIGVLIESEEGKIIICNQQGKNPIKTVILYTVLSGFLWLWTLRSNYESACHWESLGEKKKKKNFPSAYNKIKQNHLHLPPIRLENTFFATSSFSSLVQCSPYLQWCMQNQFSIPQPPFLTFPSHLLPMPLPHPLVPTAVALTTNTTLPLEPLAVINHTLHLRLSHFVGR